MRGAARPTYTAPIFRIFAAPQPFPESPRLSENQNGTVTVRDRDSMEQVRIAKDRAEEYLRERLS